MLGDSTAAMVSVTDVAVSGETASGASGSDTTPISAPPRRRSKPSERRVPANRPATLASSTVMSCASRRRRNARCTVSTFNPATSAISAGDTNTCPSSSALATTISSTTHAVGPSSRRSDAASAVIVTGRGRCSPGTTDPCCVLSETWNLARLQQLQQRPPRNPKRIAAEHQHRQTRPPLRLEIAPSQHIRT
jgi:hypothetical protein